MNAYYRINWKIACPRTLQGLHQKNEALYGRLTDLAEFFQTDGARLTDNEKVIIVEEWCEHMGYLWSVAVEMFGPFMPEGAVKQPFVIDRTQYRSGIELDTIMMACLNAMADHVFDWVDRNNQHDYLVTVEERAILAEQWVRAYGVLSLNGLERFRSVPGFIF
jgi:hypothetical protein